jgi:hypothetical protein
MSQDENDNNVQQILTYFLLWRLNMFPVTDFVMRNMKMVINSLDWLKFPRKFNKL